MLLNAFLNLLGEPPVERVKSMRQILNAVADDANIRVVSFDKIPGKNYGISYRDKAGTHIVIPFHWNGPPKTINLNRALIHISSRQLHQGRNE